VVQSRIGEGGMGEVYLARDVRLDRDVALKVLPQPFMEHAGRLARFEREARVLASLNHPNIGHIYGLEEAEGVRALVLELVKGPTLESRLLQGPIPLAEALVIAIQIADALQAAHALGIVHRDLKPSNVMFGGHGHVKVMDFGLAKRQFGEQDLSGDVETRQDLTHVGTIVGTPAYMAPEQILGGDADARSDIFSFGVVLFELLAGGHPFRQSNKVDTMSAIVREAPVAPARRLDAACHAMFEKLLAKDPRERFQAMTEVGLEVRRVRERLGGSAAEDLFVPLPAAFGPAPIGEIRSDAVTIDPFSPADSLDATVVHSYGASLFVGRGRELAWLTPRLDRSLQGHGQLAFVVGEAGSGKSTLLRELTRQAQAAHADLLSASSVCNALTGFDDPYLPFSQLLSMLLGNLEDPNAALVDPVNVARLRSFFPTAGRILTEQGPDLIDVLVPGGLLAAAAARELPARSEWLNALEADLRRRRNQAPAGTLDQAKLFQQYTDVLVQLSRQRPLLLVIDDMQWADNASVALFGRLVRHLQGQRIFLVGAYRPDEVSVSDRKSLLPKSLQEYKRQLGDIWLEVGPRDDSGAREFLDSYLDAQPNTLDENFRRAFLDASRGHALFTVELFRSLIDRGVLEQDDEGRWTCVSPLEITDFPARIEGVIEERFSRLDADSAEILRLASVEGERFTAQAVARLLDLDERSVVRRIAAELMERHGLVEEAGEVRTGRTFLNRYRFRHALFQQYLYQRLTAGERRILHGDMLHALETVHASDLSSVAIALARHAREARLDEVAVSYLIQAGDLAVQKYAHAEARAIFANALDILDGVAPTDAVVRQTLDTVVKYTTVSFAAVSPQEHLMRLGAAETLGRPLANSGDRDDLLRLARLDFWIGRARHYRNDLREAIERYERVAKTAEEQVAPELTSMSTAMIGRAQCLQGFFPAAEERLRQALPLLEDQQNWGEYIWARGFLGLARAARGAYAEGLAHATEALDLSKRLKFGTGIAASQILLWGVHLQGRDAQAMLQHAGVVQSIANQAGDRMYVYLAHGMLSWAHYLLGDLQLAREEIALSKEVRAQLGSHGLITDWFEALEAEILADAGEQVAAVAQAERALAIAGHSDGVYARGIAYRALGTALAAADAPDWSRVNEVFGQSVDTLAIGDAQLQQARTYEKWDETLKRAGRDRSEFGT
jgi:tetratricopeptide (TPR) repeat protein